MIYIIMINFFKRVILWIYIKIHSILINISIALYNTEVNILKANPDDLSEKKKKLTNRLHRVSFLNKFHAGQKDEKYVKDYYELLKKADEFMKTATTHKKAVVADKYSMSLGRKDKYGRRYEHIGFFYDGHKFAGKTIGEVFEIEMKERRTKDDDYELLYIFNNKPIEVGLSKIKDVVDDEFKLKDLINKSKTFEFPMKINRTNENVLNKIEQITEFLHVKKIGFNHRQLEFFIPQKFKLHEVNEESQIFKEIVDINQVYIKNDYGELIGYNVQEYFKKIFIDDKYVVLKFNAIEMETIK